MKSFIAVQFLRGGPRRGLRLTFFWNALALGFFLSTQHGAHLSICLEILRFEVSIGAGLYDKVEPSHEPSIQGQG